MATTVWKGHSGRRGSDSGSVRQTNTRVNQKAVSRGETESLSRTAPIAAPTGRSDSL